MDTGQQTTTETGRTDFAGLFRHRRDLCRELLDLSRKQEGLIEEDDYVRLLSILSAKQRILGRLDEMKQREPNLLARWRNSRDGLAPSLRDECELLLAEAEALVAELIAAEKQSTDSLVKRRDSARRQLEVIARGSQAHHAYRDSLAPATHRHLNVDR